MQGVAHFPAKFVVVLRGRVVGRFMFFAHLFELFGGIEGVVGVAVPDELGGIFFIDAEGLAFALAVGAEGAALERAFVGFQATPGEAVVDVLFRARDVTALVGVFDAEDEFSAMLAGEEIVIENGPDAAQVQASGWAGGESQSDFLAHRRQR